jgi:hypothetical protein
MVCAGVDRIGHDEGAARSLAKFRIYYAYIRSSDGGDASARQRHAQHR